MPQQATGADDAPHYVLNVTKQDMYTFTWLGNKDPILVSRGGYGEPVIGEVPSKDIGTVMAIFMEAGSTDDPGSIPNVVLQAFNLVCLTWLEKNLSSKEDETFKVV